MKADFYDYNGMDHWVFEYQHMIDKTRKECFGEEYGEKTFEIRRAEYLHGITDEYAKLVQAHVDMNNCFTKYATEFTKYTTEMVKHEKRITEYIAALTNIITE